MYNETYGVIYEVIARKFRTSMEPFWLENWYICRVSDTCIQRILQAECYFLWQVLQAELHTFLCDVIPWINKANLALYIHVARTLCAMPRQIQRSEWSSFSLSGLNVTNHIHELTSPILSLVPGPGHSQFLNNIVEPVDKSSHVSLFHPFQHAILKKFRSSNTGSCISSKAIRYRQEYI